MNSRTQLRRLAESVRAAEERKAHEARAKEQTRRKKEAKEAIPHALRRLEAAAAKGHFSETIYVSPGVGWYLQQELAALGYTAYSYAYDPYNDHDIHQQDQVAVHW